MSSRSKHGPSAPVRPGVPRLAIRGPVMSGLAAIFLLLGGLVFWSTSHQISHLLKAEGALELTGRITSLRQQRGGAKVHLYAAKGDVVEAGQIVARLSSAALDAEIAELRAKADRSRTRLAAIRAKGANVIGPGRRRQSAGESKVGALARQVAEVEAQAGALNALITKTRKKIAAAQLRAPSAGRVIWVMADAPGSDVEAGAEILKIAAPEERLRIKALLTSEEAQTLAVGASVRVILTDAAGARLYDLDARLTALSPEALSAAQRPQALQAASFELTARRWQIANKIALHSPLRAEILINAGSRSLLEHLAGPLPHWLKPVFALSSWRRAFIDGIDE